MYFKCLRDLLVGRQRGLKVRSMEIQICWEVDQLSFFLIKLSIRFHVTLLVRQSRTQPNKKYCFDVWVKYNYGFLSKKA